MRLLLWSLLLSVSGCQEAADSAKLQDGDTATNSKAIAKSYNGPFGIAIGTKLSELDLGEPQGDDPLERPVKAPRPHPAIEAYAVYGTSETGVCKVFGVGRTNENDGSGAAIRGDIDSLAAALEVKYGKPESSDICSAGDIACQNQFWMMTLAQGQRVYAKQWTKQNEAMKAARIKRIDLMARGLDIQSTDFLIGFTGNNEERCEKAASKESATNL